VHNRDSEASARTKTTDCLREQQLELRVYVQYMGVLYVGDSISKLQIQVAT
jgi:hypothetical protein